MLAKDRVFAIRAGTYTSSDIKEASFNYGYISGDTFKPGGTVAGSAKLTFTSIITSFNKLDKVYPEIGLKVGDSFEWVAMGEYFVNDISIDRNRNTTELDLMDGMFKLNQPYISDLTYPAQIRDVIREICVKTGVELETDDLGFRAIQHHIQSKADKKDITFREVLSQAIQLLGFSAFFNRKGNLEIRGLIESNITITADNYFLHGLTKSEIEYQIAGITCKKDKETLTVGLRTGRSLELENSFMNQNLLDELYYELKDIKYYPFSLDWQGHLKLDIGQWVTLKTNKNETYKVPVLSQSFSFKGGLKSKISADSKAGNDTQYAYKGFLGKRIEQMSTEIEAEVQQQLEYKDKEFDEKINKAKSEINDGLEQSKADAEAYADNIKQQIDGQLAESNRQYQQAQQAQDRQIADVLAKANANANLASDAQRVANQAKSDAANALASATQLKADAVNEAQRLVNTLKTETVASSNQLKQQIETVGNQLSSQQDELLQATQTVRGLDTQVKSVANQLGTQQTTITQLVNDGNARGQKIADFETSLDGVTTKLQNLWNGSRNLLSNTELLTGYEGVLPYPKNHYLNKAVFRWTHKATDTTFKEGLVMQVNDTLVNPKEMIVSFYAVANRSTTIRCYMFNPNGRKAVETSTGYTATNVDGYAEVTIGTAWRRYWVRYTYQVGYVAKPYVIVGRSPDTVTADSTVSIVAPALYHGHYNRDWQPSDVDIVSDFAIYKQTIDQNLAQLGSDIRTANGSVTSLRTEYNQTKTEIALLASKSDFDALTQKTQSLEASLKVQAGKIDLKAEKTSIDTINQQISSAQAELTVVNDAIAQRVTKTDFNAVKRTAEANATAITQVNNAIELKAEKTYVEGVKSTADSALAKANTNASTITQTKAELKIANDAIDTKATKIDLNNLTGRMSTAETTIRTQAGQIEQRLTATQVNELVDGKGYATSSSVQNIVKETADSFSRTISAVENKIPTEAGGTNLVRGSADLKQGANGWREGYWRNSGSGGTVEYNATLPSSPVKGIVKGVKIVNNNNNQIGLCQDGIALEPGTYTMSVWVIGRRGLKVHVSGAYSQDTSNPFASGNTFVTLGRYGWTLISQTFTLDKRYENLTLGYMMLDSTGTVYFAAPYIHKSSMSGDWSPAVEDLATVTALHEVKDTVSSHTRTISALDGSVSQAIQTATGILSRVGTLESNVADKLSVSAVQNQVSQLAGSWAVQNLTSSGQILNQINLLANGTNRIDGRLTHITGQTLIDNGVINNAMIGNLDAGKIKTGTLDAARIRANSIDGSKIVFDQAFLNKMTANEALFKQLFAQSAFITSVQAVAVSAKQIAGGIAKALNGGMDVNFDESKINFYTNVAAIRRIYTGHPTQFIKFETEGNYSRTIIGSNRNGGEVFNSATFAGIVVENTNNINTEDNVRIYGDNTLFRHAQGDVGWNINSVTQRIVPANINAESEIWSKHFVAPDKNSKPVRLDTAVAALWDIWNHIIYNNFEFNQALRTHIKARRDNWKFELNL
ncbi:gp58-like family protein [Streptococcus suis]|nr:gp58-like family protein [Streptococcus suis]